MNLVQIRNEVLARGFDPVQYGGRVTQFINDAQNLVARRVDYYVDEASETINTVTGTVLYPLPGTFARVRELFATDISAPLMPVALRDIDASINSNGRPVYYALDGAQIHLYPTPDNIYPLELRYWTMPPALVNDTDVPTIPADWHQLLWLYATWMCYESDDDAQMGQYWEGRFEKVLAEFTSDVRFPSTDFPTQADGMWGESRGLSPAGTSWTLYTGYP